MELFKMGKNVRINIYFRIWWVKWLRSGVGKGCLFHVIIPTTFYFLVFIKLKNLHTSACLKLNHCTAKHKPKM